MSKEAQARYRKSAKGQAKIKAYRVSEASKLTNKRWYENNKYKAAAHNLVKRAVAAGRLDKLPCKVCGDEKSQAHHPDYDKPLDVVWLCQVHHRAIHK